MQDTNGRSFEDDHESSRWNTFISGIFQKLSGMSVGPAALRSSFVTYLLRGDGDRGFGQKVDQKMQEQFAFAMRHSVNHVSQLYVYTCTVHVHYRDVPPEAAFFFEKRLL